MKYWARFKEAGGEIIPQDLHKHCEQVGHTACFNAQKTGFSPEWFPNLARLAGLLHDFGKYGDAFQDYIRAASQGQQKAKTRHAIHGSFFMHNFGLKAVLPILSHHSGLPDYSDATNGIKNSLETARSEIEGILQKTADSQHLKEIKHAMKAIVDFAPQISQASRDHLFQRMALSCLVDADRLESARFVEGTEFGKASKFDPGFLLERLQRHIKELQDSAPGSARARERDTIYQQCLKAAGETGNIFSLTVPTGAGKTLSSMAFALRRAVHSDKKLRRIIVVIPYLSIIEQNAAIYRSIFGSGQVLEHHSGDVFPGEASSEDESRLSIHRPGSKTHELFTENWDAPIVVTTTARFFDSLFSNRPKDLRRAHNIASSVVIFDEIQSIPMHYFDPIAELLQNLAENWNTTCLLCTATPPAFETASPGARKESGSTDKRWPEGTIVPVIPTAESTRCFEYARRTNEPDWNQAKEEDTIAGIAAELTKHRQVLCIVNKKRTAADMFGLINDESDSRLHPDHNVYHLSSLMCPAHRLEVIKCVKEHLERDESVVLISTQVIEAGVDLDFPVVFREFAPLASIVQAAGRCNREGRRETGRIIIFRLEGSSDKPYGQEMGITREMVHEGRASITDPEAMQAYFDAYYMRCRTDALFNGAAVTDLQKNLQFKTIADGFDFIDSATESLFVPHNASPEEIVNILENKSLNHREKLRQLRGNTVGLSPWELESLSDDAYETRDGYKIIRDSAYSEKTGIVI